MCTYIVLSLLVYLYLTKFCVAIISYVKWEDIFNAIDVNNIKYISCSYLAGSYLHNRVAIGNMFMLQFSQDDWSIQQLLAHNYNISYHIYHIFCPSTYSDAANQGNNYTSICIRHRQYVAHLLCTYNITCVTVMLHWHYKLNIHIWNNAVEIVLYGCGWENH